MAEIRKDYNADAGFTLIESLIYIALFFIIIGGGMIATYQIIQSTDRTAAKSNLEQDANFIMRKVDLVILEATSVYVNFPEKLEVNGNPDYFTLSDGYFLKEGDKLNSSRVIISNLTFYPITVPYFGIRTTFTATTSDGKVSQDFSNTKYLRYEP